MAETTTIAQPTDDPGTARTGGLSRLNQALAWVGIVAGGLFIVAAVFFAGFFLNYSEHMHMSHAAMSHDQKDCCADMKPGDMKPGATGPAMMAPLSGR